MERNWLVQPLLFGVLLYVRWMVASLWRGYTYVGAYVPRWEFFSFPSGWMDSELG